MKKIFSKIISATVLLMLVFSLTGCTFVDGFKKGYNDAQKSSVDKQKLSNVIKSTDGKCQVSVPKTWGKKDGLNEKAIIQIMDSAKDSYLICIPYNKSDFASTMDVSQFTKLTQTEMNSISKDCKISNEEDITVNNSKSKYYEAQGEVQSQKVTYSVVVTEGKSSYYEILTYCYTSKIDTNRTLFKNILKTFKEIK